MGRWSIREWFSRTKKSLVQRKPVAGGYKQSTTSYLGVFNLENLPPFTLLTADLMLKDPHVNFGLTIRNGGLSHAEVEIDGPRSDEVAFVRKQWDRIWNNYSGLLLQAKQWGRVPFEVTYKYDDSGMVCVDELHDFHPRDARLLLQSDEPWGIRFRRVTGGQHDLQFPACLWCTYNDNTGNRYGESINLKSYPPFWEKWMERGAKDILRLRMIRDGYSGDVMWVPDVLLEVPDNIGGSQQVAAMDVYRQALEARLSGSVMMLPEILDDNGNRRGEYVPPADNGRPDGILEWNERLDWDIWKGQGVVREVVEAASTGSGFSGRTVPLVVFLTALTSEAKDIVRCVDRDVLRPLTHINFGREPSYEITVKSLVETFTDDMSGTNMGGAAMGGTASQRPVYDQQQFSETVQFRDDNPWIRYEGPRGGRGWKHATTGDIRYQDEQPGRDEVGSAKAAVKKQPKKTTADKETAFRKLIENKSASDQEAFLQARKDGINIPPAWTEVTYYGADKDIIAKGVDSKGRKQRAENPAYRQRLSDENNARISRDLKPRMAELRKQLRKDAAAGNEEAKALYLISLTGFRIGGKGDGKASVHAFGASTLQGEHVTVDGDTVTFDFPGKKGVRQQHTITDSVVADMVRNAEPGKPIFQTRDSKVRDAWKERYKGTKVHDVRHVVATELAETELASRVPPYPKTEKAKSQLIKEIATAAGSKLGNNPSQALSTYIDPQIWTSLKVAA